MAQRGPMMVASACVIVAFAAFCAAAADGLRAQEACLAKPNAPSPPGQHWYFVLDRATKRQCWHLLAQHGAGVAKIAAPRLRHAAARITQPAEPPAERQAVSEAASAPVATGVAPATPAAPPVPEAVASAGAPPPTSEPTSEPTRQPAAAEPPPVAAPAPALAAAPAPVIAQTEAAQPAASAWSLAAAAWSSAASAASEGDHTFALIILAAALLVIAGPVRYGLRAWTRWWTRARVELAAPVRVPARRARELEPASGVTHAPPLSPPDEPRDNTDDLIADLRHALDEMLAKEGPRASTAASA